MSERERLPNRRGAEFVDFEHEGRKWTVTVGRFADGRIAELSSTPQRNHLSSSWRRRARSSRVSRFKAGARLKRCATPSQAVALARWALRWR
jgi:hypothetical protein